MGNMSYCRFENTAHDLDDCKDALERLLHGEREERGEEICLSHSELKAAKELVETCLEIVTMVQEYSQSESLDDCDERDLQMALDEAQQEAIALEDTAAEQEEG